MLDRTKFYLIVAVMFLLDYATKAYIVKHFSYGKAHPVISSFLYFTPLHNKGGVFGLAPDKFFYITILTFLASIFIVYIYEKKTLIEEGNDLPLALVLAGALGNLFDRVRCGYVIDFIDVRIWPVFNLADVLVCSGIGLLMINLLFKQENKQQTGGE